jgi:hypothetical protein
MELLRGDTFSDSHLGGFNSYPAFYLIEDPYPKFAIGLKDDFFYIGVPLHNLPSGLYLFNLKNENKYPVSRQ